MNHVSTITGRPMDKSWRKVSTVPLTLTMAPTPRWRAYAANSVGLTFLSSGSGFRTRAASACPGDWPSLLSAMLTVAGPQLFQVWYSCLPGGRATTGGSWRPGVAVGTLDGVGEAGEVAAGRAVPMATGVAATVGSGTGVISSRAVNSRRR
jgi:hypothetical protein